MVRNKLKVDEAACLPRFREQRPRWTRSDVEKYRDKSRCVRGPTSSTPTASFLFPGNFDGKFIRPPEPRARGRQKLARARRAPADF